MPKRFPRSEKYVTVSARALAQRINRKLKSTGRELRKTRRGRAKGEYIIVDTNRGVILAHRVHLGALAQKLGVMKEWEILG